jgi:hypothetical protein
MNLLNPAKISIQSILEEALTKIAAELRAQIKVEMKAKLELELEKRFSRLDSLISELEAVKVSQASQKAQEATTATPVATPAPLPPSSQEITQARHGELIELLSQQQGDLNRTEEALRKAVIYLFQVDKERISWDAWFRDKIMNHGMVLDKAAMALGVVEPENSGQPSDSSSEEKPWEKSNSSTRRRSSLAKKR